MYRRGIYDTRGDEFGIITDTKDEARENVRVQNFQWNQQHRMLVIQH